MIRLPTPPPRSPAPRPAPPPGGGVTSGVLDEEVGTSGGGVSVDVDAAEAGPVLKGDDSEAADLEKSKLMCALGGS